MNIAAVAGLTALSVLAAVSGCSGYMDSTSEEIRVQTHPIPPEPAAEPAPEPAAESKPPQPAGMPTEVKEAPPMPALPQPEATQPQPRHPTHTPNLRLSRAPDSSRYLSDELGQALYMFVGDVAGASESACLYDCAHEWPAFDVEVAYPGADLDPKEVSRFHRQDGAWQTTYKGHPLYYRAIEAGLYVATGDGIDGRWFLARDYLAFMSTARSFAPEGGGLLGAFLTDGFGRTLYVCLDDQPSTDTSEAVSSCDGECLGKRPIFPASAAVRTSLLPAGIDPAELRVLIRPDALLQLTYRGWPLYYFSGDLTAGSTEGHNDRAWRAFDPVSFGNQ